MQNEKRIEEIKRDIDRLQNELKAVRGYSQLKLNNAKKLIYPMVLGRWNGSDATVEQRYLDPTGIALTVRKILTPEHRFKDEKGLHKSTYPKKVKDLSEREYDAICACVDECIDVIDKHSKQLHPGGIAFGRYVEGQSLFKEMENDHENIC